MKVIILVTLFMLIPYGVGAKTISPSTPANYVLALQAANWFLTAWSNRDAEVGTRLISRRLSSELKKEKNEDWFRGYIVGVSNPHHLSFEIGQGKSITPKRLSFPVVLYEHNSGESKAFKYKSKIEVIQDGDSWRVDVLPDTPDNE